MGIKDYFGSIADCLTAKDFEEKSEISDTVKQCAEEIGYRAAQSINNLLSGTSTASCTGALLGGAGALGSSAFTAQGLAQQVQQAQQGISQQAQMLQQQYNTFANQQIQNQANAVWISPIPTTTTNTYTISGTTVPTQWANTYPGQVINTGYHPTTGIASYDLVQEVQALKDVIAIMRSEIDRMRGEIIRLQTFGEKDVHKATDEIMRRMDCYIATA